MYLLLVKYLKTLIQSNGVMIIIIIIIIIVIIIIIIIIIIINNPWDQEILGWCPAGERDPL